MFLLLIFNEFAVYLRKLLHIFAKIIVLEIQSTRIDIIFKSFYRPSVTRLCTLLFIKPII